MNTHVEAIAVANVQVSIAGIQKVQTRFESEIEAHVHGVMSSCSSTEFKQFAEEWDFKHITSSPT